MQSPLWVMLTLTLNPSVCGSYCQLENCFLMRDFFVHVTWKSGQGYVYLFILSLFTSWSEVLGASTFKLFVLAITLKIWVKRLFSSCPLMRFSIVAIKISMRLTCQSLRVKLFIVKNLSKRFFFVKKLFVFSVPFWQKNSHQKGDPDICGFDICWPAICRQTDFETEKSYSMYNHRLLHSYLDTGFCKIPGFAVSHMSNFQTWISI